MKYVIGSWSIAIFFLTAFFFLRVGFENKLIGPQGILTNNQSLLIGIIFLIIGIWRFKKLK